MFSSVEVSVDLENVVRENENENENEEGIDYQPLNSPPTIKAADVYQFTSPGVIQSTIGKNLTASFIPTVDSPIFDTRELFEEAIDQSPHDEQPVDSHITVSYAVKVLALSTLTGAILGYTAAMITFLSLKAHEYNGLMCHFYNNNATNYGCNFTWPSQQIKCDTTSPLSCSFQNQSDAAKHAASDYAGPLAEKEMNPVFIPAVVAGALGGGLFGLFSGAYHLYKKKMNESATAAESVQSPQLR